MLSSHPYQAGALMELLPGICISRRSWASSIPPRWIRPLTICARLQRTCPSCWAAMAETFILSRRLKRAGWTRRWNGFSGDDPALEPARAQPLVITSSAPASTVTPQTVTFKVVYRPEPNAWFVVEMRADQTLHDLHHAILDAADFYEDHLYSFYMSGQAWDNATEYWRGPDARHSSNERISRLPLRMKQRFLYLYDYGDQHEFDVQNSRLPVPRRRVAVAPRSSSNMARCHLNIQVGKKRTRMKMESESNEDEDKEV